MDFICGNSCTWAHDVRLHIAGTNEPKSPPQTKQGAIYKWSSLIDDTQSAQISQKEDRPNIHTIIKTMCSPSYHRNG